MADDLLKNDGKRFIEMMEQLAERRMAREQEARASIEHAQASRPRNEPLEEEDYEEDDDDDYEEEEEDEYDSPGEEVQSSPWRPWVALANTGAGNDGRAAHGGREEDVPDICRQDV